MEDTMTEQEPEAPCVLAGPGPGETFADRLNHLFEVVHPKDRGPYTNTEVAAALAEEDPPVSMSRVYLWQLRTGQRDNPTRQRVEALARFFGVPTNYFFDDDTARKVGGELELLRQMRDSGVQQVAMRVAGLSPESLQTVLEVIDHVRKSEGLPPLDD
jgi:transcriptional regulator with XRE-family HTH domain